MNHLSGVAEEVHVVLIETIGTLNTGNVVAEKRKSYWSKYDFI